MLIIKWAQLALKHYLTYYLPPSNIKKVKQKFDQIFNKNAKQVRTIAIENLTKVYPNGIKALDNLSLKIKPREFVVLLGPSGCGKTTLLRMIAGLESVSDGYVKFDNVIINGISAKDRDLAMVFQNYALYPFMSVFKNIAFGLKNKAHRNSVYKYSKDRIKQIRNPLYNEIAKIKAQIKIHSRIDDKLKDDILRNKRLLKTIRKTNNPERYKQLQKQKVVFAKAINKFKNDNLRKEEIQKLKVILQELKTKNKKLQVENKIQIQKDLIIQIKAMYESAKLWKDNIANIIEKVTKILGINMFLNRKPADLSGGQRQRVALARAISKETGLYLYDEPLSNLDAKLRANMRKEIRHIHNMMNATSIYVTHDQIEAMSMADRIVVMHKGYIQQIGTPRELMEQPLNLFVARFIGNTGINTFSAQYLGQANFEIGNNATIQILKERITLKLTNNKNAKVLGIRPEHIITDPQITKNMKINKFNGQIVSMEMLGNEVLVYVENKLLKSIQMIIPLARGAKIGDSIDFVFNPNKTYIYDAITGYNLLVNFDEDNQKAKEIWVDGEEERKKNIYILNKEKNKLSFTSYIRNLLAFPISKNAQQIFKKRRAKIDYGDQKRA